MGAEIHYSYGEGRSNWNELGFQFGQKDHELHRLMSECVAFERFKLLPRPYQTPIHRPRVTYRYDPETQTVELVERRE